jgi:hypothetical protein
LAKTFLFMLWLVSFTMPMSRHHLHDWHPFYILNVSLGLINRETFFYSMQLMNVPLPIDNYTLHETVT